MIILVIIWFSFYFREDTRGEGQGGERLENNSWEEKTRPGRDRETGQCHQTEKLGGAEKNWKIQNLGSGQRENYWEVWICWMKII